MEIKRADGRALPATLLALAAGALFAAAPAVASTARLIGPGGFCLGVEGEVALGARIRLEACDGEADQRWEMPPRGFSGPLAQSDFCLDGRTLTLANCGGELPWSHDGDGLLATGFAFDRCLDALGSLVLATCSSQEEAQLFLAEGEDAWTPASPAGAASFLPMATPNPLIWYGQGQTALLRSENGGRSFAPIRAATASDVFAVSPLEDQELFLLSRSILERSLDGGRSWTPVAHLPPDLIGISPEIVPSPRNTADVYVYGLDELWASHDHGRTFARRGDLPNSRLSATELLDLGEGRLLFLRNVYCFAGCEPENLGVWRSSDDGASWQQVVGLAAELAAAQLVENPNGTDEIRLVYRAPGAATDTLLSSSDGGLSFAPAGPLPSRDGRIVFDAGEPDALYLFERTRIWRSRSGSPWQELALPNPGLAAFAASLTASRGRLRLAVLAGNTAAPEAVFFDSPDGGDFFLRRDPLAGLGAGRDRMPVIFTGRQGTLYHLEGGRLLRSDDGGLHWRAGAGLGEVKEIAADPRDPERVFALLPAGLQLSEDGGASFRPVAGPAGSSTALAVIPAGDTEVGRTEVVAAALPSFQISRDGGRSWSPMPSPRPLERFKRLVGNERVLFAVGAQNELFRTYDAGESWELLNLVEESLVFGSGLLAYAPAQESALRVSADGGETFVDRYPPDELGAVTGVSIDERNHIYVAGATAVLRSSDWGATWQSLGQDLLTGDGPRYAVAADPFEPGKLYHTGALGLHAGRFSETPPLDLGDRFAAKVKWRDYLGQTGEGVAQALTRDSGTFWLFTPGRAEVSVKVLDGRAINGKFWVFLASMTDVELDLEVEDRATGEIWTYHNPLGRFLSFGDIEAFPRAGVDPAEVALPAAGGVLQGTADRVTIAGRFEVTVDFAGAAGFGKGQGRRLNAESAAFYFFDRANVELIVNLLDGRPINGKYWVYFGSMSDVAYTVTIKDLTNGRVKTYSNPAGAFASRGDVDAFD